MRRGKLLGQELDEFLRAAFACRCVGLPMHRWLVLLMDE